ncbi:MAG: hypothetical protein AAGG01_20205 [Planctomycetota bacterium]
MLLPIAIAASLLLGSPQESASPKDLDPAAPSAPLSLETLDAWADFIRPNADELSYEAIGWRNAFWPAVEEARRLGRPILLWTMNGHPLGCT